MPIDSDSLVDDVLNTVRNAYRDVAAEADPLLDLCLDEIRGTFDHSVPPATRALAFAWARQTPESVVEDAGVMIQALDAAERA